MTGGNATAAGGIAGAARAALAERLDATARRRAPACVAAVTQHGRVVAAAAHGRPRADGTPTAAGTVFRIASMSKSFLAATALALRDEGLLDLHAPVTQWVPELAASRFAGQRVGDRITLDALLSNRAGLGEDNPWGDEHLGESRDDIRRLVEGGIELTSRPGTEYQYSNLGQSLVGRAIEAVTGTAVEDVVRERLLDPLGLSDTRASADRYPQGADLAQGFRTFDDGASFTPETYVGTGALGCIGSLFSTVADIAVWMDFLGSAFDDAGDAAVLSAASRREMQTAHTLIVSGAGPTGDRALDGTGYGYGLVVEHDRRFGRVVQHAGGLPGFSSHMRWHPASGIGVVVFGNSDAFGAGRLAAPLLHDVLLRTDAPAALVRPWPQTVAAAQHLDELVRSRRAVDDPNAWGLVAGLSRNVLRDVPASVRSARLGRALDELGAPCQDAAPFAQRVLAAADPASLRWSVPCAAGALVCDVRLVGLPEPLVQAIEVRPADEGGRRPRGEAAQVIDHHRAVLG